MDELYKIIITSFKLMHVLARAFLRLNAVNWKEKEWMMSLYELGPMIFEGTDKVIAFLRTNNLLASTLNCIR